MNGAMACHEARRAFTGAGRIAGRKHPLCSGLPLAATGPESLAIESRKRGDGHGSFCLPVRFSDCILPAEGNVHPGIPDAPLLSNCSIGVVVCFAGSVYLVGVVRYLGRSFFVLREPSSAAVGASYGAHVERLRGGTGLRRSGNSGWGVRSSRFICLADSVPSVHDGSCLLRAALFERHPLSVRRDPGGLYARACLPWLVRGGDSEAGSKSSPTAASASSVVILHEAGRMAEFFSSLSRRHFLRRADPESTWRAGEDPLPQSSRVLREHFIRPLCHPPAAGGLLAGQRRRTRKVRQATFVVRGPVRSRASFHLPLRAQVDRSRKEAGRQLQAGSAMNVSVRTN